MPRTANKNRPKNGFESFFIYFSDFIHLNINLGGVDGCKAYHDRWMQRYSTAIAKWSSYDTAIWCVRCRQSLKLSFSATLFALSADTVGKTKSKAGEHFLAYYSMLHAMWAVLYLHPDQTVDQITGITHSKVANLFHAEFASGKKPIIVENVRELAADLRFLREYYSYRMPLNSPFEANAGLSVSYSRLGGFVKQSIQLANLHSHFIKKAADKLGKSSASIRARERFAFQEAFFQINGKAHDTRSLRLLDGADKQAQSEFLAVGCDIVPLSLGYDHMFDDFMMWGPDQLDEATLEKVRTLVARALG